MNTGERIKELRKSRGVRRRDLAELLGVSPSTLWRWEKGDRAIREDRLREIAYFLKVPITELIGDLAVFPKTEKDGSSFSDSFPNEKISENWFYLPVFHSLLNLRQRLAAGDCDARFALPHTFVGKVADSVEKKPFVVQIEGNSMAEARICNGAYAVINPAEEILDGDAALVKVDSRYVVRWVYRKATGGCELRAASGVFPPLFLDAVLLHDPIPVLLGRVMWVFSRPVAGL